MRRRDYRPPPFHVERVALEFDLDADATQVCSTLELRRTGSRNAPLVLDGDELELTSLAVDGKPQDGSRYELSAQALLLRDLPERCTLHIGTRIRPVANSALLGLFASNGNLFTQCEAEGFRRITFFPDRPDVLAVYDVTLRAESKRFPVLLANGNLVEEGSLPDGRRFARWSDPFPKPSYLFALVAGRFDCLQTTMRTAGGREVLLQVWVEPGRTARAEYALAALQRAIVWDEKRYGRELDLDRYMIVVSNDFNLGAMENKGLNIFNARRVLADPQIATDIDYERIESIVAHEYFHNWTGNRVTCRDWFQLSLKEGLTVFREQQFAVELDDAAESAARRIGQVKQLREEQFTEDAGPLAHPVRPDSYQRIDNFYTSTVYEKGAEVVRMLHTLLGDTGFRRGMDLYFERHDGQAVTCDDLVQAMERANGRNLAQFSRWYAQAGTPKLTVTGRYLAAEQRFELTVLQSTPATAGQPDKAPMHIPLTVGLVDAAGRDMRLTLEGEAASTASSRVLELTEVWHNFSFVDVPTPPVPSLNRGFAAPVQVDFDYDDQDLALLARRDSDMVNRWDALRQLALRRLTAAADAFEFGQTPKTDALLAASLAHLLADESLAASFRARAADLPSEAEVAEARAIVDPPAIRSARLWLQEELGRSLGERWETLYESLRDERPYAFGLAQAGRRALRNTALSYLAAAGSAQALDLARRQLETADNMTDRQAALAVIVNSRAAFKADVLVRLARDWANEPLLMNKWFDLQATAVAHEGEVPVLERVKVLLKHRSFAIANPNNARALILAFCERNPAEFHRADGAGYRFWTEQVLALDRINPTVAALVARCLERWRRYTPDRQPHMRQALEQVAGSAKLSPNVREIVLKAVAEE